MVRLHLQGIDNAEDLLIALERKAGGAGSFETLEETLRSWLDEGPVTLLLDEVDGLVASKDGEALLGLFRRLKSNASLGLVLTGYLDLYRQALDRRGPAYNFADTIELGPLDVAAAIDLAVEPLARLGMHWDSQALPERLVHLAGAYPHLVQLLCVETLHQTTSGDGPGLTAAQLERACRSPRIIEDLVWFVFRNTPELTRWICVRFCTQPSFSWSALEQAIAEELRLADAADAAERALAPLVLFGYIRRAGPILRWCAPLFYEQIAGDPDRDETLARLVTVLGGPSRLDRQRGRDG